MMKLNWIEFKNIETGLECERVTFNIDTTLLVGLSGVGKSQILHAILMSLGIASGSLNNIAYLHDFAAKLNFTIEDKLYEWSYRIEKNINDQMLIIKPDSISFCFKEERLICNGEEIAFRNDSNLMLKDFNDFPAPKKDESLLSQYSEDPKFQQIFQDFRKICPLDLDMDVRGVVGKEAFISIVKQVENLIKSNKNEFTFFSRLPVSIKLYIARKFFKDTIYVQIFDYIKELFPDIEDIDVVENSRDNTFVISIVTYGRKLLQQDISNGMLKTIYYIVELVTMRADSLVLIDEFENGLGVNCLNVLADLLLHERKDLQFIITSHHPTIIGGIPASKWKIIDRNEATIINKSAKEYGVEDSIHSSYFNLLKQWEFEGKI